MQNGTDFRYYKGDDVKILIAGDWHISDKKPENRIDDYFETVKRKIRFILETAKQENVNYILQPGDFFDSPSLPWNSFISLKQLFDKYKNIQIFSIHGQHDLRYRIKGNTALDALSETCPNIKLLSPHWKEFYGSSYNEEIPKVLTPSEFNILLTHRMILQDKLWTGQEEYTDASNFLRTNVFKLIVSGDNHQSFIVNSKITGKYLFNCGALLRNKTDMVNHKPFIVIFDTETKEYKQIFIPIEPPEKVFNLEKIVKEKEKNEYLEAFVSGLSESHKEIGLTFEDSLNNYLNENDINSSIRQIIEESKR